MPKKPKHFVIDELTALMRKPSAAPLLRPREAITAALSMMIPGPALMISPNGPLVSMILFALSRTGWKIVPMERSDYEQLQKKRSTRTGKEG